MKQTIGLNQFRDAFHNMGRGEQFSYEGLGVLFDALSDFEAGAGEELELDVIGLCCEFAEMTEGDIRDHYTNAEDFHTIEDFLQDRTWLCGSWGHGKEIHYIFQQF